jgi:hypothetical protein
MREPVLCWSALTSRRVIHAEERGLVATRPVGETLRNWDYTVAGEADGIDKSGVVLTRIAWTDLPEACYSIVSDTTLSPASLSGIQ